MPGRTKLPSIRPQCEGLILSMKYHVASVLVHGLSIEAKLQGPGHWEVYTDCGREWTGVDAVEWARKGVELGAGEILITSIDKEGTGRDLISS